MKIKNPNFKMDTQLFITLIITGVLAGILSGLAGVGGGIIIVPMLIFFAGFSQLEAQGTSLGVLLLPVVCLGALTYYKEGFLKWQYSLIIAIGFLIGGILGSKIAININQKILSKILGVILLYVSIKMLLKK